MSSFFNVGNCFRKEKKIVTKESKSASHWLESLPYIVGSFVTNWLSSGSDAGLGGNFPPALGKGKRKRKPFQKVLVHSSSTGPVLCK